VNQDPLDSLQAFYDGCVSAPVPPSLTAPPSGGWRSWLAIPLTGLVGGAAAALALFMLTSGSSPHSGVEAARAIARTRLERPLPPQPKAQQRRLPWSA